METDKKKILEVKNLKTYFYTEEGVVKAVDGVSFNMYEDEVLGLVGETGCGKSVTALSILQLVRAPGEIEEGEVIFKNVDLLTLKKKKMRDYRGKDITMIFQDPLNSLNPVMTVGTQVKEVFELHQREEIYELLDQKMLEWKNKQNRIKELEKKLEDNETNQRLTKEEISDIKNEIEKLEEETRDRPTYRSILREKSRKILEEVGIPDPEEILERYPHELSGGMRQRVMISMALSCNPSILIADEPTTALDVTIQAQILDLMKDLKNEYKTSVLMITHDLGVIAEICDRVAVMYSGNIVEYATATNLFKNPRHPYTKGLISAIPTLDKKKKELDTIRGSVPNLIYPPEGCRFHPRCDYRLEVCDKVRPLLTQIGESYFVACHLFDPQYKDSPKYEWGKEELERTRKI
ncbi:MAG: ATP-binding cassette domain-containing protein [Promethearchaeota archaeon]|nr:MAG: ATP-binding cassette domain-containing protein [Candidatus Lokiarchaeota archaeon]